MTPPLPLKTLLLGLKLPQETQKWTCLDSIQELSQLAKTAGLVVHDSLIQARDTPHPRSYVGEGKVQEIKQQVQDQGIQLIITDDELSPSQQKNLESELNIKVLDRTGLILDIFAQRARTAEAQLQVELAQLDYLLPRLTRLWTHLSRLGGGIGTRGPGETQLETDKRQIKERISTLQKKLKKTQRHREVLRQNRDNIPMISGAIIGYTNAGKSTLINALTAAHTLAENALFATLDPTTKHWALPNKDQVLLTDTVGFIQKLPTQLITSFRATLEEVCNAHFLLHVVDASNPKFPVLIETTQALLKELKADTLPQIYVFNKRDQVQNEASLNLLLAHYTPHVLISAQNPLDMKLLENAMVTFLQKEHTTINLTLPFSKMTILNLFHLYGRVLEETYTEHGVDIKVDIHADIGSKIMAILEAL